MKKKRARKIHSILFITLSNLGDIVLTTPALQKLRSEFPGAAIDVVTGPPGEVIFRSHPSVRDVTVRVKRAGLKRRICEIACWRKKRYDAVVDLKNSLVPYLVGARFHTRIFSSKGDLRHKKDIHLSKLEALGIDVEGAFDFFVPVTRQDKDLVSVFVGGEESPVESGKKVAVLNAGAKSHLKRWPSEKYAALADILISKFGCKVVLSGNTDDIETVESIVGKMKEKAVNLCGKTSLGALFELMRRSDLVVTNDSAPLHLASAAGTPTVAVFGPSDERKYGPLAEGSTVVSPLRPCRPCEKALCRLDLSDGCITEVSLDEVLVAAEKILNTVNTPHERS